MSPAPDWAIFALVLNLVFLAWALCEHLVRSRTQDRCDFLSNELRKANAEVERLSEGVSRR